MTKIEFKDLGVVVPVREGSSRVKDKVVLPFTNGLNLLEWKLEQLKEVIPENQIIVSTDSKNLQKMALERGVMVRDRDNHLCDGHIAAFSDVIKGVVRDIPFKHIAWATVVVPLMAPKDYIGAFQLYKKHVIGSGDFDSLVSVNLLKDYFWDEHGPINYQADRNHTVSQDLPNIYRVTNGLYIRPKEEIMSHAYFLGKNPVKHEVSKMAGIDIDEWQDYQLSLAMLQFYDHQLVDTSLKNEG